MTPAPRARLQAIEEAWLNLLAAEVNAYSGMPSFAVRFAKEREAVSEAIAAALITAACHAAEGEEDMSVQVADYEIALQRAAAIILKLRGCAEDEIDDQLIASLVDHELRESPAEGEEEPPKRFRYPRDLDGFPLCHHGRRIYCAECVSEEESNDR